MKHNCDEQKSCGYLASSMYGTITNCTKVIRCPDCGKKVYAFDECDSSQNCPYYKPETLITLLLGIFRISGMKGVLAKSPNTPEYKTHQKETK